MLPKDVCINCGRHAPHTWFCPECTQVKEAAYAVSARLGETYPEVIIRRDRALERCKKRLIGKR